MVLTLTCAPVPVLDAAARRISARHDVLANAPPSAPQRRLPALRAVDPATIAVAIIVTAVVGTAARADNQDLIYIAPS